MDHVTLSVIVPCYNEERGIHELHYRVTRVCQAHIGDSYELLLINDGSRDTTWQLMKEIAGLDHHVVAINLSRNFGHQLALSAGLQLCRGELIFMLDADLQDPPELLPDMVARLNEGFDVVYGQRIKREGETLFKKASAFAFYRLLNKLVDIDIPPDTGDFRLINRRVVDILNKMPEHYRFIRGMVSWIGLRQTAFPYERAARFAGESKYPIRKMLRFSMDAITSFSVRPLRLASYIGILFGVCAFFLLLYIIINYFLGYSVKGWTSLVVLILFLGGIQLIVAGVMGEYLGRLYIEAKGRPMFVIQEIISNSTSQS